MFTLYEQMDAAGARHRTELEVCDGGLRVVVRVGDGQREDDREEVGTVTLAALEAVMERYGKPLDGAISLDGVSLDLGNGTTLRSLRHLARYDVIARDFVVLERHGREPLAELSTAVAGALAFLAGRQRRTRRVP